MSQNVFEEDFTVFEIIIFSPRNTGESGIVKMLLRSPAARVKDVFWECVPYPLSGFYDSLIVTGSEQDPLKCG